MSLLTQEQRERLKAIRRAMDDFVAKIADYPAEVNANPAVIRPWAPGAYIRGDVRMEDNIPYSCIQSHDSAANPDWKPSAQPTLWMQYHGTTPETARPWIQPTMAEDSYRAGEYMIWTDGALYRCTTGTNFSPAEYPAAWEIQAA